MCLLLLNIKTHIKYSVQWIIIRHAFYITSLYLELWYRFRISSSALILQSEIIYFFVSA